MSKLPSMPFFVDAYLADTTHLSLEEHGAYMLLLMAMWRRGGAIPDDDKDNSRMLGLMPRSWLRLKPRLMPLLSSYGPEGAKMLTQKRLQKEWNYSVDNSLRQSQKGRLGAEARWEKDQLLKSSRGNGVGNGRPIAPIPNSNNTTLSTSNSPAREDDEDAGAEIGEGAARLLNTGLMKRSGR